MHRDLAIRDGRLWHAVRAILRYEPEILRGLTWRYVGYVALIGLVLSLRHVTFDLHRAAFPSVNSLSFTSLNTTGGLFVLIFGVALTNLKRPRLPGPVSLAIAVLGGCFLAALLNTWVWSQPTMPRLRVVLLEWGLIVSVYWFMERTVQRTAKLRDAELDLHRLEAQMLEARLQVLQAQVEPHFLFNTLAHVQQLYQTDPARGRLMLDSFCGYVRAALPRMRSNHSTLGREVELARSYLDTQSIRMGRRLQFEIAIPEKLLAATFPPMMLLSLVENAIKHGLNPLREGGSIRVAATSYTGALRVTVADTGVGLSTAEHGTGTGVGLSNVRSRLATLYGGRGRLMLARNVPQGFAASIEVPLGGDRIEASEADGKMLSDSVANLRRTGASS